MKTFTYFILVLLLGVFSFNSPIHAQLTNNSFSNKELEREKLASPANVKKDKPILMESKSGDPVDFPICPEKLVEDFVASGTVVFDTDALTYGGLDGGYVEGNSAVFHFNSIEVPVGTTVLGIGSRPLILRSNTDINISGTVHVNGSNATPTAPSCQPFTPSPGGAGGGAGGLGIAAPGSGLPGEGPGGGQTAQVSSSSPGAGGAGYGGAGGAGGGTGSGAGGSSYGDLTMSLQGGSGGSGAASNFSGCQTASGGGGGGAILLDAKNNINISASGIVSANGGNGALSDAGGSGAGSGGGIVLRGCQVNYEGIVRANGGNGGNGGCCGGGGGGGGGRVLIYNQNIATGTVSVNGGNGGSGVAGTSGSPGTITTLNEACSTLDFPLPAYSAAGNVIFDTDALTYSGSSGGIVFGGAALFFFESFEVPSGATVIGIGSRPLIIMSLDDIDISGTIHVNGSNATPTAPGCPAFTPSPGGAGGGAGGLGIVAPGDGNPGEGPGGGLTALAGGSRPGAGGAGYGGDGGAGGGPGSGAGGSSYGDLTMSLQGGSGGSGAASNSFGCQTASGGGGGGAMLLFAKNNINITASGIVSANGGNGALSDQGGSGAGSGGGIVLRGCQVNYEGIVRANGGNGGNGGCCGGGGGGGGGRVLIYNQNIATGTVSVNGGNGGSGVAGTSGSLGTVNFINSGQFPPNLPADISVCPDEVVPEIVLNNTTYGAPIIWENDNPAIGLAASGTGNIPTFVSANVTSTTVANITIRPAYGPDGNTCTCSQTFTITIDDDEPPTINCTGGSITFNGELSIALDPADWVVADDNCILTSVDLNPNSISCSLVGTSGLIVLATAEDSFGNTSTCTFSLDILGLPCGWDQDPDGVNCASGSSVNYDAVNDEFLVTSTNCFYSSPFTADQLAFAQQTLCGDGSITAEVKDITGGLAWAGIVMRENNTAGAKKIQLMTNLSNFARREVRTVTNGSSQPQQIFSPNRYWLRLVRQGNQFSGFLSPNGINWYFAMAANISMNSCAEIGLVVTNYNQSSTITATFGNVSISGGGVPLGGEPVNLLTQNPDENLSTDIDIYPNPAISEINIDLRNTNMIAKRIEIHNVHGQIVRFVDLLESQQKDLNSINVSDMTSGMYFVHIIAENHHFEVKRIILNGMK